MSLWLSEVERSSVLYLRWHRNKCSIMAATRMRTREGEKERWDGGEGTRALVLKQIRLVLVSHRQKGEKGKRRARIDNKCVERFMLIVLFAPSPSTSTRGSSRNSKQDLISLNDGKQAQRALYNKLHRELLSSYVYVRFFEEQRSE